MSYCLNPHCSQPHNPPDSKFCHTCGSKLRLKDRYRAIGPLGQGGFGKTYLAMDEDKPSKPSCVIKQLFPLAQGTQTVAKAAELFAREAVQLDILGEHPQIPDLLAYFTQEERQYLIQEFIEGENLARVLQETGTLSEGQIRALLADLLPVLRFVHEQQVIHRDIKPENIIYCPSDQRLFLVDFGAAKAIQGGTVVQTGTSIGSAGYVAPEQAIGKATFASDLYSLGVTCVHLLTGEHPFELFDPNEGQWAWQSYLQQAISDHLTTVLNGMLHPAISRRYQTAQGVLDDLATSESAIDEHLAQLQRKFTASSTPPQDPLEAELEKLHHEFFNKG
ncbi:serine/threonine protein kinase [Spirulina sp. CS-785/01]|uniref:serine/threonine protein kinase n=1 Tax=Spirulina sp. CS-785/01 TaxID=3021716 RepID=UPI00233011E1|nr:serine/threonine protein kinase [Spirulina sp. CS-785/01]MDB9315867.1 serine/threonine protein kinase [Spirulina sp. CS-785/01]